MGSTGRSIHKVWLTNEDKKAIHEHFEFQVGKCDRTEFMELVFVLRECGIKAIVHWDSMCKTGMILIDDMPTVEDIKRMRTRNAGRPKRGIQPPENSPFTVDTTLAEFMEWREEHSAKECMEALGLPQATYYRKLQDIEIHADNEDLTLADID